MESIMQTEKECYVCHTTINLHKHHLYKGTSKRKNADKLGLWCYLCYEHHEGTYGVHGKHGHNLDVGLKEKGQKIFERAHTREEFTKEIGRSYL